MQATMHPNPSSHRRPSPARVIFQWIFRERATRPAAIELDVLERTVQREQKIVATATGEAVQIDSELTVIRGQMKAMLTDAATPGIIDEREALVLAEQLIKTSAGAAQHVLTLETLK